MKQIVLVLFYLILFSAKADAQTYWINKPPFLDSVYHTPKEISQITNISAQQFLPIYLSHLPPDQYIVKNTRGMYILIDGTGQVYKATGETTDKMAFTRIDSTYFSGNTFHAINFSWRDTLYSFGGYGFWKTNGELRKFKPGSDWDIVKLNKECPQGYDLYFYSPKSSSVFYVQIPIINEVSHEVIQQDYIAAQLNLKTKTNRQLGKLNNMFLPAQYPQYFGSTALGGMIINIKTDVYLFQFDTNKIFKLINQDIKKVLIGASSFRPAKNIYELDGKLYFTSPPYLYVHSVPITIKDFELVPYQLYEPVSNYNYAIMGLVLLSVLSVFGLIVLKKKKKYGDGIEVIDQPINVQPRESLNEFTKMEVNFVNQILQSVKNKKPFSMEDTNQVLGLSKKTVEVQKKIRSETINRINHKFRVLSGNNCDLIERIRLEEDRRYFYYTVSKSNIDVYLSVLGKYIK